MLRVGSLILLLSLTFSLIVTAKPSPATDEERAQEIIKQARAAIGGEASIQAVQTLRIKGQYRRILGERELSGEREVNIMLPDKYLAEDEMNPGGLSTAIVSARGLNGAHAWSGSSGGEGGHMIIRMGTPGGPQATPEQVEAIYHRQHQAEFTRYLLSILVTPPPSVPVAYKYVGEADVESAHADVVEITGPEKLSFRLFVDKQTHIPLLLSYRGAKPRIMTAFNRSMDRSAKPDESIKQARDEAEKKLATEPPAKPEEVDFYIRLTDFKKVEGLSLPHKLTFLTGNEVSEEFAIAKYQLNPQLKADKFQKH